MAKELRINIIGDASKLTGAMGQAGSQVDKFAKKIGKVGKTMTIVGGVVTAAFGAIVFKTTQLGDTYDKMAKRTNIAVETLSALGYAAKISGADLDTVEKSLRYLARGMDDMSQGVGEAKDAFEYLNISVVDTQGNLRPTIDVLKEAATKLAAMTDETKQIALATDIFGARYGTQLLPLLKEGGKGIEVLMNKAKELGVVMSTEAAAKAAEFNDRLTDLKEGIGAAGRGIGEILIPPLTRLAEKAVEMIKKIKTWADAHKPLVEIIIKVGATLGVLAAVGGPILMAISALLKMKGVITAVSSMMKLLPALFTGISSALGPLAIQIGLIAANLYIWIEVWKEYQKIMNATRVTTEDVVAAQDRLREVQEELATQLGITIEKLIEFQEAGASVSEMMGIDLEKVSESFEDVLATVDKMAAIGDILQPAEEAIQKILDSMTPYEKQLEAINVKYDEAIERIKILITDEGKLKAAIDKLNEGRRAAITLLDREKTALDKVAEAKKRLADMTKSLTDKIYEFIHTEEEVKLRDINREYDLLIENAKEVFEGKKELIEAIKIINKKRQEEINNISGVIDKNKELVDSNKEVAASAKEAGGAAEEAGEAAETAGERGIDSWSGFTITIHKATVALSSFTKESVAAAIATIKMRFFERWKDINKWLQEAGRYSQLVRGQYEEALKTMNEQIKIITYGYNEYLKILQKISTEETKISGGGSFVVPSYQTGTRYVPETQLALVHRGEEINPPGQRSYDQRKSYTSTSSINIMPGAIQIITPKFSEADGQEMFRIIENQAKMRGLKLVRT